MDSNPYKIIAPKGQLSPVVLSVPHCGVEFPREIKEYYNPSLIKQPDDTDWFVERLYNFATEMGITIIYARYSRWVIDLNRTPDSQPLYNDGRIITGLTPATDFKGNPLYKEKRFIPDTKEINRRIKFYYEPYHQKIAELLHGLQQQFKNVLLWDAHSIRTYVPTIRKEKFPDMILGNNDQTTASKQLIKIALSQLQNSEYQIAHNNPFKGGYITRSFGNPNENIHALQLEMVKSLYMNDDELTYNTQKADKVRKVLRSTFEHIINALN